MMKFIMLILLLSLQCKQKKVRVEEVTTAGNPDQEIVLFNTADIGRGEIAHLLSQIDSCGPLLLGIDVLLLDDGKLSDDTLLESVLEKIDNDVLAYQFDSSGKPEAPLGRFRKKVTGEGYINLEEGNGLIDHFTPLRKENGVTYESFALRVVKQWKPSFEYGLAPNKPIEIYFKKSQEDFNYFERPNLEEVSVREILRNKIVLVGYLGPRENYKLFTPLRSRLNVEANQPDTYRLVVLANAIRTLLEYYNATDY